MKYAIVHIADIHYKKDKPESSSSVIKACLEDVKKQKDLLPEYKFYIAITGDIVYSGGDYESYLKFKAEFDNQLNSIGLSKDFRIIVPGNHDIDRKIVETHLPDYVKIKESNLTEEFFNDHISESDLYIKKFENYELFEADFARYGIDFSTHGKGWMIDDKLGVYCLNTALCSFCGVDKINDEQYLSVGTRALTNWCNTSKKDVNILLMHHPIDHFTEWSKQEVKNIVENNFFLCLCGHRHSQSVYYNMISQNSLICSGPQLFSKKEDKLGYAIICIEDNNVEQIRYRQYANSQFFAGSTFAGNDEGVVYIKNNYMKNRDTLKLKLDNALAFFANQQVSFIEPKLSETREFNNDDNLLLKVIQNPESAIITALPQFGLTCLAHHMRLEAYKNKNFWIYIDAAHVKARKVENEIVEQLHCFGEDEKSIRCIIIDSWDSSVQDNINLLKIVDAKYLNIPILIMSSITGENFASKFSFSKLKHQFISLHLQALGRNKVRDLVAVCGGCSENIAKQDEIVSKMVKYFESINIHRTPLNCLTLLKVFERNANENLMNKTKMIKIVLDILFTDRLSLLYSSEKPEVDECEFIFGRFCKALIENRKTQFKESEFIEESNEYCKKERKIIDVKAIITILEANHILIRYGNYLEFKHRYWVFYFAASYMLRDNTFKDYILNDKRYINYPEIIDFYTGIDGRRSRTVELLMNDTIGLVKEVDNKIGIPDKFNPLNGFVWDLSNDAIKAVTQKISEKVQESNLPSKLKDQHADESYNSLAPYNQEINHFLHEYSVISLMQSIKASSRALRNSHSISAELRVNMLKNIINGWEQISRVIFWLSPILARAGRVDYEGISVILTGDWKGTELERLKRIYVSNPMNVVRYVKDDLSSKKIGPLLFEILDGNVSDIQKHFVALFMIQEKPIGWFKKLRDYMNLLHKNSFYLGDILGHLEYEIDHGFVSDDEYAKLKYLVSIVLAKHKESKKITKAESKTIDDANKLHIDKILASQEKPLEEKLRKIQK